MVSAMRKCMQSTAKSWFQVQHASALKFAFILVMILSVNVGRGQVTLPHHDPFNYTVGQTLVNQSSWTLVNASSVDLLISSGNLSYSTLPTSTGNKISFVSTGEDAAKLFTQQTTGTVYFSFILNVTNLGSLNATGGYFAALNEGISTNYGASVWTRSDGSGYDIGINPRTTAANTANTHTHTSRAEQTLTWRG